MPAALQSSMKRMLGTAALRADLMPEAVRDAARNSVREYREVRAQASSLPTNSHQYKRLVATSEECQGRLWVSAQQVVAVERSAVTSLYVQAINELIDSYGRRKAEIVRHVPPLVHYMLISAFLLARSQC